MFLTEKLLREKHLPDEQVAWFVDTYPKGVLASDMLRYGHCQVDAHWLYYMLVSPRRKKLLDSKLEVSLRAQHAFNNSALTDFYAKTSVARTRVKRQLLRTNKPIPTDQQIHYNLLGTTFKHRHAAMLDRRRHAQQVLFTQYFIRACELPDSLGEKAHKFLHQLRSAVIRLLGRYT